MSHEISIRQAEIDDAAVVLGIERSCGEVPHWSEAIWAQVLAQSSQNGARLYGPRRVCYLAEHAGEIAGFIVISITSASSAGQDVAEIESVVVRDDSRRRGVGRSLCLEAIYWSQTMGAQSLQLEVRSASVAALALYRSLGFVEQGRRCSYYADPNDDAVLMALLLTSTRA
jgi:ribosomal-protein-alanine N-acetyltransferase